MCPGLQSNCSLNILAQQSLFLYQYPTLSAAVKLNSLVIKSSGKEGKAPKTIRLFKNTPSIGFGEAESAPAVQEFELSEKNLEGEALVLRSV